MALVRRAVQTAVVISFFSVLASISVFLRLWTRLVILRAPGREDWILVSSWLCAVGAAITMGLQVGLGLGNHSDTLSPENVERLAFFMYISIIMYCASLGLTKVAILMQYERVFQTRRLQIWCWTFIAINAAFTIATVGAAMFVCIPVHKFWKPDSEGKCLNKPASWLSNAALNIVTDLIAIILPMPVLKRLNLPKRQKWLLMGVFALGFVVCIISIARMHSLFIVATSTDPSFDNAAAVIFSIIEINVAIVCACLPTLKPLLAQWMPGINRSSALPRRLSPALESITAKHSVQQFDDKSHSCDRIHSVTQVNIEIHRMESLRDERESNTETMSTDTEHIV